MKISCPKCGQHYDVDDDFVGENVNCVVCGNSFVVKTSMQVPLPQVDISDSQKKYPPVEHPYSRTGFSQSGNLASVSMPQATPSVKPLICEMCGGSDLIKDNGVFVCQSCGTKYSLEEAKKMMIAGTVSVAGTVKVDMSDKLKNLYKVARRAKDQGNSTQAIKYFDLILQEDANSWEANFYTVFFKAADSRIVDILENAIALKHMVKSVASIIMDEVEREEERRTAYEEISSRIITIGNMLFNASKNHFENIHYDPEDFLGYIVNKQKDKGQYQSEAAEIADTFYVLGDALESNYRHSDKAVNINICVKLWDQGVKVNGISGTCPKTQQAYIAKIKHYHPNYAKPTAQSGCYIATSIYGSYDCPEVWTLRRFRDNSLASTWFGKTFISLYYTISPRLVENFGSSQCFQRFWRYWLDKLVRKLQSKGVKSSPYDDPINPVR